MKRKSKCILKCIMTFVLTMAMLLGFVPLPGRTLYVQASDYTVIKLDNGTLKIGNEEWTNSAGVLELPAGNYKLGSNITTSGRIDISGTVTLDLNGHTIDRGLSGESAIENGNVITVNRGATLTLMDSSMTGSGKVTGGNNTSAGGGLVVEGTLNLQGGMIIGNYGGGVYVFGGTFTMTGGSITANTASGDGGGVFFSSGNTSFTMSGGSITGNTAGGCGGGVKISGAYRSNRTFVMTGGCITNNIANSDGGGVYVDIYATEFCVSGTPVIKDNKKGEMVNNVYLPMHTNFGNKIITVDDKLADGASIGVTMDTPGVFTQTDNYPLTTADVAKFVSDDDGYLPKLNSDNQAELTQAYAINVSNDIENGTVTTPGKAVPGEIVTVTVSPDSGYDISAVSYDDGSEHAITSENGVYSFTMPERAVTVTAEFIEKVAAPIFNPASDTTFTDTMDVTVSCETEGAKIYYTTDGSTPTPSSTLYTGAISISESCTIKAIAVKDGMPDSDVSEASYTIGKAVITPNMVSLSYAKTAYTGKALKPKVTVKNGSKTLTAGTDYTVSYKNNKNIGKATVTITGKGSYTGVVNKTFTISAPAKGKVFTVSKCKYKITDAKKYTVSIIGTSVKGKLTIGSTVQIGGKSYKITAIAAKAFKNNTKLTSVVIGKNVSVVGKQAFYGCKKLTTIVIKTTKLNAKNVGSAAFKKVPSSVKVTVPQEKKKTYAKLLKAKGLPANAKVK